MVRGAYRRILRRKNISVHSLPERRGVNAYEKIKGAVSLTAPLETVAGSSSQSIQNARFGLPNSSQNGDLAIPSERKLDVLNLLFRQRRDNRPVGITVRLLFGPIPGLFHDIGQNLGHQQGG